jgi:hypothetical protein
VIPRAMIEEARLVTERLAAGTGCPTVLMELLDLLEAGAPVESPPTDRRMDGPMVIARPRGRGKTSELIQWLVNGHLVQGWPGWSRLIVVADERMQKSMMDTWNHQVRPLVPGGLGKVVITAAELHNRVPGTRINQGIQVAFDDIDALLWATLGLLPDVMTMTARPVASLPGPDPRPPIRLPLL